MTLPKVETVNAVTMEHGRDFAEGWFEGTLQDAYGKAKIMTWPEWDHDQQASFGNLKDVICGRVFEALKEHIAETFVRIANAVIDAERMRPEEPLNPPKVEMVETVTPEQGSIFAEQLQRETADSEIFDIALSAAHFRTFPDDGPDDEESAAQKHFHDMTDEIRDRIHNETKQLIADAFVRVVGDVISRERQKR